MYLRLGKELNIIGMVFSEAIYIYIYIYSEKMQNVQFGNSILLQYIKIMLIFLN